MRQARRCGGAAKGCWWEAAAERAVAAHAAEQRKAAAHDSTGKLVMPKPTRRSGRWSCMWLAVRSYRADCGSGWPNRWREVWLSHRRADGGEGWRSQVGRCQRGAGVVAVENGSGSPICLDRTADGGGQAGVEARRGAVLACWRASLAQIGGCQWECRQLPSRR
jgi:hypothetical protein